MGKSTISMVIFNSYVKLPEGNLSIPINTIFRGMNIHKSQLFWCELQGYKVLTHCHLISPQDWGVRRVALSALSEMAPRGHSRALKAVEAGDKSRFVVLSGKP